MAVFLRAQPPLADMLHITSHLRDRDREEIFATRYGEEPKDLARDATFSGAFRWIAYHDGVPTAAIGAVPRWPNVWTVWAFGTDDWDKTVLTLTRHVRRFMIPAIYGSGAIRADCLALAAHEDARKWLTALGATPEKVLDNWGKNGEAFVSYCWTREQTKGRVKHV